MTSKAELQYQHYEDIRAEIQSSVTLQSRIVLGSAIVTGLLYTLQFTNALRDLTNQNVAVIVLGSFPLIILGAMTVWGTEYARVARASDYLALLENELNQSVGSPTVTWENWIRTGNTPPVADIHYKLQARGYVVTFYLLGLVGLYLFIAEALWPVGSLTAADLGVIAYTVLVIAVYAQFASYFLVLLSPEPTYDETDGWADRYADTNSTYSNFQAWRDEYSDQVLGTNDHETEADS